MALTNPALIATRTISTAMKQTEAPKEKSRSTLMGPPKKKTPNSMGDNTYAPSRRVASYIEDIRKLREEAKNA
jgi:hypothetical protein